MPMTRHRLRTIRLVLALSLACLPTAGGAHAQQQEEVWVQLLRQQLLDENNCELNFTTNEKKYELGGQQMVEARAHCLDKRAFDARWLPSAEKFEVRECDTAAC